MFESIFVFINLLGNLVAIETLRKKKEEVREELIAVESIEGRVESSDQNLKKTWMSRVRLWNAPVQFHNGNQTLPFKSVHPNSIYIFIVIKFST